jgi:Tol biopolymer transport system component
MPFAGGPPIKSFQISNLTSFRWTADARSLVYTKNDGGVDNFWSQPIAGGMPKQITHFNNQTIESFDVSRDGKWVVMSRGTARQDVVLIRESGSTVNCCGVPHSIAQLRLRDTPN